MPRNHMSSMTQIVPNDIFGGLQEPDPNWMPDPGVLNYVRDMLNDTWQINIADFNKHWIPIIITSTFDWLRICGWWTFTYSSTHHTGEEYSQVWKHHGLGTYEFDPAYLMVFRYDEQRNQRIQRLQIPGLTDIEKSEVIPLIRDTVCPAYGIEAPPVDVCVMAVWATLLWVLDERYGKDWLYMQGPLFSCTQDYGSAFINKWKIGDDLEWEVLENALPINLTNDLPLDITALLKTSMKKLSYLQADSQHSDLMVALESFQADENLPRTPTIDKSFVEALRQALACTTLLDPEKMEATGREVGSCSSCGANLWCVEGWYVTTEKAQTTAGASNGWVYLCSACASCVDQNSDAIQIEDGGSQNLDSPNCKRCKETSCPHLKVVEDGYGNRIPEIFVEAGSKRLAALQNYIEQKGHPRVLAGQTADDLADHFYGRQLEG